MREAMVVADPSGNQKLAKATEGGRRKLARDDAAAAAILAVAMIEREREETEEPSPQAPQPTSSSVYLGRAASTSRDSI